MGGWSSAQEGSGPEVVGPTQLVVTDSVANALIGFDSSSLAATINEGIKKLHFNNKLVAIAHSLALSLKVPQRATMWL